MHELDKTLEAAAPSGQCSKLVQAISRLADNRQPDGSSLVSSEDRSAIINGCHDLMIAYRQAAATTSADKMGLEAAKAAFSQAESNPNLVPCSHCAGKGHQHGYGEDGADPGWCTSCGGGCVELVAGEEDRPLREAISAYLSTTSAGVTEELLEAVLHEAGRPTTYERKERMRRVLAAAFASRVAPVSQKEAVPVAWRYRYNGQWYIDERKSLAERGLDLTPPYTSPPTAPAGEPVGIKATGSIKDMLTGFGAGDINYWADYVEVPVSVLENIRSALRSTPTPVSAPAGEPVGGGK